LSKISAWKENYVRSWLRGIFVRDGANQGEGYKARRFADYFQASDTQFSFGVEYKTKSNRSSYSLGKRILQTFP
jgi:hypothetical protein